MAAYGSAALALTYHADRGNAAWASATVDARNVARLRGSEYVDRKYGARFPGTKTDGRDQVREWPRTDAEDRAGNEFDTDEVPIEVEHASYEAGLRELVTPGSLQPDVTPNRLKKSETVFGAVAVVYQGAQSVSDAYPVSSVIEGIITPVLIADVGSSLNGSVLRG